MFRRKSKKSVKKSAEDQLAETNKFNVTLLSNIYAKLLHEIVPGRELEFPLLDQRDSKMYGDLFGGEQSISVRNFRGVISPSSFRHGLSQGTNSTVSSPSSVPQDDPVDTSTPINLQAQLEEEEEEDGNIVHSNSIDSSDLHLFSELVDSLPVNNDSNASADTSTQTPTSPDPTIPPIPNKRLQKVIHLIHTIGELIARDNIPMNPTQSPVFEYFCEKNILSFFVDIAKASSHATSTLVSSPTYFDEMVYTSLIKSQILRTCSTLLSSTSLTFEQHPDRLYFLLSHNCMNELISTFVPLQQWSDEALMDIIPAYTTLLKTLGGILNSFPDLGALLVQTSNDGDDDDDDDDVNHARSYFPIFHASVEMITSTRKIVLDPDMQETIKHILSQLCSVSSSLKPTSDGGLDSKIHVQSRMEHCLQDLESWIKQMCNEICMYYENLTQHLVGSFHGDEARIAVIQKDIELVQKHFRYMNDILWCRIPSLNTILCERLLEMVIYPHWLKNLNCASTLDESEITLNVAKSQGAMYMIIQMFLSMDYRPLAKMVATAILHPNALTESYLQHKKNSLTVIEDPVYTSFLTQILQGTKDIPSKDYCVNACRNEVLRMLRGDCGDYRFIGASMMLESILDSATMDPDFLSDIDLFPPLNQEKDRMNQSDSTSKHPFEDALGLFFMKRLHIATSSFTILATDCATSLLLSFLNHVLERMKLVSTDVEQMSHRFRGSSIIRGVFVSRRLFAMEAQKYQKSESVGPKIMANLFDMEISRLYKALKVGSESIFASDLERRSARSLKQDWRILLSSEHILMISDIDKARMAVHMVLRLRMLCKVLRELHDKFVQMAENHESFGSSPSDGFLNARIVCEADSPILELLGRFHSRLQVGKELDLRGKTVFTFFKPSKESTSRRNELIFMIDLDELLVLKPHRLASSGKGTVLFYSRLKDILTAAQDGACLHLALRPPKDENALINNGKDIDSPCDIFAMLVTESIIAFPFTQAFWI